MTPPPTERPVSPPESSPPSASTSVRVLAGLGVGALLYLGHMVFVPIALAVLFALILTGPVERLNRWGVPRTVAAVIVMVLLMALAAASINLLWTPAQNWWAGAPQTLHTIERRLRPVSQFMNRLELLTSRAGQLAETAAGPPTRGPERAGENSENVPAEAPVASARPPIAVLIFDQTRSVAISIVTVLMLMVFLLAGGPPMLARMSAALASDLQLSHTLRVINDVRSELSRYYGGLALINIGLGSATAALMTLLHMPNPLLWGAVAGVLNFIPYVGSATTLVLLTVVAFVTFNSPGHIALVPTSYLGLATIEGQVAQPLVIGRRLELNPIIVFLALWFGGWFWGVPGIIMAVPTLVAIKVAASASKRGEPLITFLSPNSVAMRRFTASVMRERSAMRPESTPAPMPAAPAPAPMPAPPAQSHR